MSDETIKLLRELIAIDSVNPSLAAGGKGEKDIAEAIAQEMRVAGMDVEISEAAAGRPNVVGVIEGRNAGRSLMFCGHTDTVGVEGMKAPFDPVVRDGKVYGRGSQDMKGGIAAMIDAARKIALSGGLETGRLIVAAVADEEYASLGAEALVKNWTADAAVVTEPTDLNIAVGHKGFSWVQIITEGRAAHGSRPKEGRDAILRMGRVLARLENLNRELLSKPPHSVLGTGSLHASLIEGGREMSTYPDFCKLQLERRTISGEAMEIALSECLEIIDVLKKEDSEFAAAAEFMFGRPPYETPAEHPLPQMLETAVECTGHKTKRDGMSFWTDAAILGQAGIPSVIFGPGGAGLHSIEEYVIADEVISCRDALYELARNFCQSN
jgi:acetylornithine deacetylase